MDKREFEAFEAGYDAAVKDCLKLMENLFPEIDRKPGKKLIKDLLSAKDKAIKEYTKEQ